MTGPHPDALEPALVEEIGWFAVDVTRMAGEEVAAALQRAVTIQYKTEVSASAPPADPVSEVDVRVEKRLRDMIRERYPEHGIVGEELDGGAADPDGFVWALDPIDGTTNFLHRFPLIAVSVACLHGGTPIASAVWCSATHELRPGVYHAHAAEQGVRFDGAALQSRESRGGRTAGLAGSSQRARSQVTAYDLRVTGSAAIECAFTAAGILRCARFEPLWIWDVAGGVHLVLAAGGSVLMESDDGSWSPFTRFEPATAAWHRGLFVGDARAARDWLQGAK